MKCIECQNELTDSVRVCKGCGLPVSVNPTLEDLYFSRLTANAPPKLVQKVRSAPYLEKEKRTVTAIMLTIANIDAFKQKIPEEERNLILNKALDRFAALIFEFEGTIAKLWEDTILAFFGAPISHEDDPLRAIHAAHSILTEVEHFSNNINASYSVPMQINMVLNTGPVLIGEIKSNLRFDFRSLNNTLECMDVAIQSAVPHCEMILFEDTYRFVKPFVECSKLDDITCENIEEILPLWRVDRIANQHAPTQRMPMTQITPLIGRKKELDMLLELSETVLAGLGRVGLILGEPGIGKSRLIQEWKDTIKGLRQPTQMRWIQAHGLAFGRELAYHLLKGLLRGALDVVEVTPKDQIQNSLHTTLNNMPDNDKENLYKYLAHLLDIQLSDSDEAQIHSLSVRDLRTQYLNAIRTFYRNLAIEQPLILLLEDLHWADASSVDLLTELLFLTSSSPILICLASREEHDSYGWDLVKTSREKFGSRLTEIKLNHLDEAESQSLVKQFIEIEEIPEVIRSVVLRKSEGNPYFIEELVRMLVNEGVLIKNNDHWVVTSKIDQNKIPDSLQGLLTARIDRLPLEARLTLRVASVIGRNFPEKVIEQVMADHAPEVALMEQLSTLESIGMIKVAQINPELTYKFQHILLHDAAYRSIYETDSSGLHLSVAKALEKLYPEQKERLASQLAHHFSEGKETEKAFSYLDLAGHVSMESFAAAEAETYFRQAIQLTEEDDRLAHLYTDLGEALAQQGKHRDAIQAWKNAIHFNREVGNADRLARVYAWSARSAYWGYDPKRSLEICLEGLKSVEGAIESSDIAYLIHETGRSYLFNDQPEKAKAYSEKALEMAKHLSAFDVQAEALATIGILPTVKPKQAIAALEMAIKISESNNLYGPASRAYINLAAVIDTLGEIRLARDYRMRAIQLGNKVGGVSDDLLVNQAITNASLWLADFEDVEMRINKMQQISRQNDAYLDENTLNQLLLEGYFSLMKGDFKLAIEIFTDLIDRSRQTNDHLRLIQANRALAEVIIESQLLEPQKSSKSNLDIALSMITNTSHKTEDTLPTQDVATQCLLSSIYALIGDFTKAGTALKTAQQIYRDHPIMQDRVKIALAQARLEFAKNNTNKALKHYTDSVNMLEKMEGKWWHARIWLEMGILHLKRSEPEDIDIAQNFFRESLAEFKEMGVTYYTDVNIEKLREVKHSARAHAIAHKKITQELAEAGRVQHTFLPTHSPEIPGYDISGVLLPAHETSGDFFDFITLDHGKLGVVIADVGDKGAGAALYMAMSRTLIRTYSGEDHLDPGKVIHELNRRILTDTQHGIFLTVVFGILDPEHGTFNYVNAGHNPPFLLKQENDGLTFTHLDKTGMLVGIFNRTTWEERTININPGEVLVLYTDGITEAQNDSGDFYGNDRLIETLKSGFDTSSETFRNTILKSVQSFTGTAPRLDDITLIIISRPSEKPKQ